MGTRNTLRGTKDPIPVFTPSRAMKWYPIQGDERVERRWGATGCTSHLGESKGRRLHPKRRPSKVKGQRLGMAGTGLRHCPTPPRYG
mmetsp:Transcript_79749/g.140696  ORF Transcript_79749/g.140696 Transcript_79749/m.140696 type:complete len:87 (+) Transcript_79749:146-406(+)